MKPQPPKHLSAAARRIFRELIEEYSISDQGGTKILVTGLTAWDRGEACRKQIAKDGLLVVDRWGQRKPHPLLAAERDARAQWLQALKLLDLEVSHEA